MLTVALVMTVAMMTTVHDQNDSGSDSGDNGSGGRLGDSDGSGGDDGGRLQWRHGSHPRQARRSSRDEAGARPLRMADAPWW